MALAFAGGNFALPRTANRRRRRASIGQKRDSLGRRVAREATLRPILLLAVLFSLSLPAFAQTEELKPQYDFSMSREEKIRLAESAAPPEVSSKATVYVLERSGYVKIRDGENGFTCFVDRQDPLNLEPTCLDAEGSATTFVTRLLAEEMRGKGKSEQEITAAIAEGYKSGKFRAPQKPGIVYMMSDAGFIYVASLKKVVPLPRHLMFYAPYASGKDIGSPPAGANMPHVIREGQPDAVIIVIPSASKPPAK